MHECRLLPAVDTLVRFSWFCVELLQCLLRRSYCVNEALVSAGLGCLGEAPGFRRREDYAKLMHILGRAEQAAIRRGSGIWQGGPQEVWWRRAARRMHTGKTY